MISLVQPDLPASGIGLPRRKSIAVTGGAGFLGSHLCRALVDRGHDVVCLDNFHTGSLSNVEDLCGRANFTLFPHDVTLAFPDILPPFDEIWNLACPASPVHYQADRVRTLLVCCDGARRVVERARIDGAAVFHASTSEVYGDPEVHPQREDYVGHVNPIGPRACYDEGKRFVEALLTDAADQYGIRVRMARIFNTYGPRMHPDDGRVVSNFVVQALRGEDLTVYGDGTQTRSFCYVDDLVDGMLALMAAETVSGPVNLGNPAEIRVEELAETVIAMTGSRSAIVHRPLPIHDPRRRRPDIGRAWKELGWRPRVGLREGLERTILDFEARLRDRKAARAPAFAAGIHPAFPLTEARVS